MAFITRRTPFSPQNPYRPVRPATSKIIFLSCEGSVTEEEYFDRVSDIFSAVKTRIQFISVAEDAVHTHHRHRTSEQALMLSKTRPKQLVERIEQFKEVNEDKYQFSKYPEDEFWIVMDIDDHLGPMWIDEWNETLEQCQEKNYGYAVSNPFFEIWLLLHHDSASEEDKSFAVTEKHPYCPTSHFRNRLRELGVPLKDQKHISPEHYNAAKIRLAVERAKALHTDKAAPYPAYFATTVYLLLEKILEMQP